MNDSSELLKNTFDLNSVEHNGILVLMPFGSHLYGTNTPSSDYDFKGVFHPTLEQIALGRVPRSYKFSTNTKNNTKNSSSDIELELFSTYEFLKLATEGQTVALDMLACDLSNCLKVGIDWPYLHRSRNKFYTKNLKAFIGYARRQAAKYGVKGSRLHTAEKFLHLLELRPEVRVRDLINQNIFNFGNKVSFFYQHSDGTIWSEDVEHVSILYSETDTLLEVLGKKLTYNAVASTYIPTFRRYLASYGERAKQAKNNENIDWKALSHAVRAAIQIELIFEKGIFTLPFDKTISDYLKSIKCGEIDFLTVQEVLEKKIERIEKLAEMSDLPERVNTKWVDSLLLGWYLP